MPQYVMAGVALYGAIRGSQKSDSEKASARLSNTMASIAEKQHTMAGPALQKAMQYYMTLAGGNRGAIQGAISPQVGAINDLYKGAETRLGLMAPGPTKDRQMAEMQREKVGKISQLPIDARNDAFGRLVGMGNEANQSALGYYNSSANVNSLLQSYEQQRSQNWQKMGASMYSLFQPQLTGQARWGDTIPSWMKAGSGTKNPLQVSDFYNSNGQG